MSATQLTFARQTWNRQQALVITGVDDTVADGDVAYSLHLDASSADTTLTLPPCVTARCRLQAALRDGSCAGVSVPAPIVRKVDQSLAAVEALPGLTGKKARRTRQKATRLLKATDNLAKRNARGKRPKLPADCANAIREVVSQVRRGLG